MITVNDIDRVLSETAPRTLSEEWDNDGVMLCKNKSTVVQKVLVMLEVTPEGAAQAMRGGYDLIVTHHPFIFRPLASLTGDMYALIETLIRANISVLSYHTRLDAAKGGVNDTAAKCMGLRDVEPFGGENGLAGRVGALPEPFDPNDFAALLKKVFGCVGIRATLFDDPKRKIVRVAFVGGAGKSFFREAYAVGADAFVTGEAAHNTHLDCRTLGMCLFDCGHYYTENPVCLRIRELLEEAFGDRLTVDVYDVKSPYAVL